MQVDVVGGELVEILETAVVGIDYFAGDVARAGGAVVRHDDARIVLVGIAGNRFALGAGHELLAVGAESLNLDGGWIVEEHAVRNDLCIEAGSAEFLRDVFGSSVVLGRSGHVRRSGESLQFLAGKFGPMTLTVLGVNHKTAPIELRERIAIGRDELPEVTRALAMLPGVAECMIVSTCNRVELIATLDSDQTDLSSFLCNQFGLDASVLTIIGTATSKQSATFSALPPALTPWWLASRRSWDR